MKIKIDAGVNFDGIQPEMVSARVIFFEICRDVGVSEIRITSSVRPVDKELKKGDKGFSFHYVGLAEDYKVHVNSPPNVWPLIEKRFCYYLKIRAELVLQEQHDIVYHKDSDGKGYHFHIERDIK